MRDFSRSTAERQLLNDMAQFAIYKIKFEKSNELNTYNQDINPDESLDHARELFASMFHETSTLGLFDLQGGEHFNNYIWRQDDKEVYLIRLHKSQIKSLVKLEENPEGGAPECIEKQEESNPYCYVIFDNRDNRGQVAVEKSSVWGNNPDNPGVILQDYLSALMTQHFRLKVSFLPKMQPTRIWDYYRQLISKGDVLQSVTFEIDNPDKIKEFDKSQEIEISDAINRMTETVKATGALKGVFKLFADNASPFQFDQKVEDFKNMVRICGTQAYHLVLNFKNHKAYRCDEKVHALIKLNRDPIEEYQKGAKVIDDTTEEKQEYALVQWLDYVYAETKNFEDAAEIHRKRKGRHKK